MRLVIAAGLAACAGCVSIRPAAHETTGSTVPASDDDGFDALAAGITPLTVEQERDVAAQAKASKAGPTNERSRTASPTKARVQ